MSEIFLKILNMTLNASWLILAVMAARLFLKRAPRWVSCLLWALVAFRLICPVSLTSALSLLPSSEVIPVNITMQQDPHIYSGIRIIDNTVNPAMAETMAPDPGSSVNPMQVVAYAAGIVWIAGMIMMCGYALISSLLLKRKVRISAPISDGVFECDEVKSPFILGIFRPSIYVPSGMDKETLEYVTAHERAHLARFDHVWKPLGFLILSVYWFNPLCWFAYILLCRDIESACDEKVIRDKDKDFMAAYSQALLDCSIQRHVIAACPLAFGETDVKSRVKGVLNYKKPAFWVIIISVAVCVIIGVCFITNPQKDNGPGTVQAAEDFTQSDPVADSSEIVLQNTRTYSYTGNTGMTYGRGWIEFGITLNPDGTYTWYESPISSYIGFGAYQIEDGILIKRDDPRIGTERVNRFRMEGDSLFFIADGSDNFSMVQLEDGEEFVLMDYEEIAGDEFAQDDSIHDVDSESDDSLQTADPQADNPVTLNAVPVEVIVITRSFDADEHPETDFGGQTGTSVYAVCDGSVTEAGFDEIDGNYIIITPDANLSVRITYSHLEDINVEAGDAFKAGDVIGTLGNTGNSTGPHLGLMMTVGGNPVDIMESLPVEE